MAIRLITTAKTPIIDNRIVLPVTPVGDIIKNQAIVYTNLTDRVGDFYDGVSVVNESGIFYAQFDCDVSGDAVVSFLANNGI